MYDGAVRGCLGEEIAQSFPSDNPYSSIKIIDAEFLGKTRSYKSGLVFDNNSILVTFEPEYELAGDYVCASRGLNDAPGA